MNFLLRIAAANRVVRHARRKFGGSKDLLLKLEDIQWDNKVYCIAWCVTYRCVLVGDRLCRRRSLLLSP